MQELLHSFVAFNVNGFNNLHYLISQNISYAVILVAAVITSILYLKETIVTTVRDEHNII